MLIPTLPSDKLILNSLASTSSSQSSNIYALVGGGPMLSLHEKEEEDGGGGMGSRGGSEAALCGQDENLSVGSEVILSAAISAFSYGVSAAISVVAPFSGHKLSQALQRYRGNASAGGPPVKSSEEGGGAGGSRREEEMDKGKEGTIGGAIGARRRRMLGRRSSRREEGEVKSCSRMQQLSKQSGDSPTETPTSPTMNVGRTSDAITESHAEIDPIRSSPSRSTGTLLQHTAESIVLCPWKPRIALLTDTFGRVSLVSLNTMLLLHVWKGYREAQVGWIATGGAVALYAPRRGLLEVWRLLGFTRLGAAVVGGGGTLLGSVGEVIFVSEKGVVSGIHCPEERPLHLYP
eukprot:GHVS01054559.1.p1 GENE.GHVS01054559.1~~GHVS01054559.1.p1  ORF type:complete len:348 (-),score=57.46 GHVS01054559.1:231-1274(-)